LLEGPLVVRAHGRETRGAGHQQVVQELPPVGRIPLDQGQILRREQHRAQVAERVARLRGRIPVDPDPVRLARVDLQLQQDAAILVVHDAPDHRPLGADAHQRGVLSHPVAAVRGEIADGLDDVRLAVAVRADQHADAGLELEVEPGVAAEVDERQLAQVQGVPQAPGDLCSLATWPEASVTA
jgi:hypothetical protein